MTHGLGRISIASEAVRAGRMAGRVGAAARRGAAILARDLADEWLPWRCILCERRGAAPSRSAGAALCHACEAALPGRAVARCACCAIALAPDARGRHGPAVCAGCIASPPAFDAAAVAFDYAPPTDRWVLAAKGAQPALGRPLGALVAEAALRHATLPRPDLLAPIALSPRRLAERGFNQALEIARGAARTLDAPLVPGLLARVREGADQKSLDAASRRDNLAGAFMVAAPLAARVAGRVVGVVDDVMTTGATLDAAARVLKDAGAAAVVALAAARTA